jgi:hypothetical protein
MDSSRIKRLKELEEENRRLKQMYADLALDNKILKYIIEKSYRARGKERDCSRDSNGLQYQHHSGMQVNVNSSFVFLFIFAIIINKKGGIIEISPLMSWRIL